MEKIDTIVVGGGVVGISTAYFLAKRGQKVVLLEQGEVCSGCSRGNAGQITPGHLPLPTPGTIWRNLRWLFDSRSPLYIPPRVDFSLLKWLIRFQAACNPKHLRMATEVLCELGGESFKLYESLSSQLGFDFQNDGRVEVCHGVKAFSAAKLEAELLSEFGFDHTLLRGSEVNQFEPGIKTDVAGAIYFPESAACDPQQFVLGLAAAAKELGVVIREQTTVDSLIPNAASGVGVKVGEERLDANSLVLTVGSWASKWSRQLSHSLPVQPGKGYHIEISSDDETVKHPVVLLEERIFVTPMKNRLRLAGTMEFSGFNTKLRQKRLDMLTRGAERYFPGMSERPVSSEWCHMRPMTSDGLPIIGPLEHHPNIWVATGHGMLGVTQGPITGKLLSEWICDQQPSIDLSPVSPARF